MTAPRNPDSVIRAFLEDGPAELPDRAFDAVRRDIHRTRQRVVIGPWTEPTVSTLTRLAVAAAIVVALGFAWVNFGPTANFGGNPSPPPTAGPTASPQLVTGGNRLLQPGRYRFDYGFAPGSNQQPGASISITVPAAGWTYFDNFAVDRNYGDGNEGAGASFVVWNITNVYVDPCTDHQPMDPAPGPTVDDILEALAGQAGLEAGPLTDVTIDGYAGKFVELTITTDIAICPGGFFTWGSTDDGRFAQGTNEVDRVYALDVDGQRMTFFARIPARTTPEHLAQLESIIDSIDIEP